MARLPIGTPVKVPALNGDDWLIGRVVRHGRDHNGIYTEVQYEDGTVERVHRSTPKPIDMGYVESASGAGREY